GVPLVVFNTLGWPRTDVAEADVGFAQGGINDFRLVDSAGKTIPAQLLEAERYADGGVKRIKIAFVARDVPAAGYAVYHLTPRTGHTELGSGTETITTNVLENEFYTV